MKLSNIQIISILLIVTFKTLSAQRSSNGRHRTWWSSEEEPSQSVPQLVSKSIPESISQIDDTFNQNVISKKNDSIVLNLDDRSINLTPEPLTAEILKVDLSNSGMLIVSSSPTYLLSNQTSTVDEERQQEKSDEKNIDFVQTKRILNPNSSPKHCLSTLDCDLEMNERCLSPESEETLYYDQLTKIQLYTSIYSQYLRKRWRMLKINTKTSKENENDSKNQPICGCASPSFVRNQVTGQCELLRVVELKFRLKTDRTTRIKELSEQNFEKESNQLKLDALGQIERIIENSDSLRDIVHHFRLTNLAPLTSKSITKTSSEEIVERSERSASSKMIRKQTQFFARGLLLMLSSEYTASFDLLFTNEYCSTQTNMRMRAQEKMFHQTLAAANQTWPRLRSNAIRSADFGHFFDNNASIDMNKMDNLNRIENQSDRIRYLGMLNIRNKFENQLPFIHHRRKREAKEEKELNIERYGLDVQLIEVNSNQINICTLNANYANEQLNQARRKYDLDDVRNNKTRFEKQQKQLDYERRFYRLTYCDGSRAFCESLPRSRAGYVCVCHENLMDLSPIPELPGEYCGVKCPADYCGEGFCHVRNSVGIYPSPDHDLATQQRYLSTAGRMISFLNGKLTKKADRNSSKLEREFDASEMLDYQALIAEHKKNQTLLRQRYYSAIYSVQQRFTQLFESIPKSNQIDLKSEEPEKDSKGNENYKFDYTYSFVQTPQLVTFYCTCPGWTMGSRCQFSGWMILLVLGILVILLALITICTVSMLCTPGRSNRRNSTKSHKSTKSNPNTTSLTISQSDTSDSLDIETSSQQLNSSQQLDNNSQSHNHNQFNNQQNRQRRASEFVNDRRLSFGVKNATKQDWINRPAIAQPAFNIIHATPPHSAKDTAQKIQFIDTVTEIPYKSPYESPIHSQIQQITSSVPHNVPHTSRISQLPINQDRLANKYERKFEYDTLNNADSHVYHTINTIDNQIDGENDKILFGSPTKSNRKGTPIAHIHNVYASAGELRIEKLSPSADLQQIERRSVGSQTSGFHSGDPSLAYLSAISLKQLQFEQLHQKARPQESDRLPTTSISGPIVWF